MLCISCAYCLEKRFNLKKILTNKLESCLIGESAQSPRVDNQYEGKQTVLPIDYWIQRVNKNDEVRTGDSHHGLKL